MTGQDFQNKLDALVADLQTKGKGQTVEVLLRGADNSTQVFPLSSTIGGEVNDGQLQAIQDFIGELMPHADAYETDIAPVKAALEVFKTAQEPHEALMTAATAARQNLNAALEADAGYQTAKTALDAARSNPVYVASSEAYKSNNVSENFGNLGDAKGKYVG